MTKAAWSDVVQRTPSDQSSSSSSSTSAPIPRPRGRPPANHSWDSTRGAYVPTNVVVTSPAANSAWILAASNPDLVANHKTPSTIEEARSSPDAHHWQRAIDEELASLRKCQVWRIVLLSSIPPNARPIPTKWVFKIKGDRNGCVKRYKARLVVCGYRQRFGRDYTLTFAPVAHAASIRMVLALATVFRMSLRQFDVKTAFLYGKLPPHQRVFLRVPKGVTVPRGHVLQLLGAMYGLKQAPLLWNRHLHRTLTSFGFQRSKHDPCVYFRRRSGGLLTVLAIVVDDILCASSSPPRY